MLKYASVSREKAWKWGLLVSEKIRDAQDKRGVYTLYYDYDYSVDRLRPHQILAVNRGEAENILPSAHRHP